MKYISLKYLILVCIKLELDVNLYTIKRIMVKKGVPQIFGQTNSNFLRIWNKGYTLLSLYNSMLHWLKRFQFSFFVLFGNVFRHAKGVAFWNGIVSFTFYLARYFINAFYAKTNVGWIYSSKLGFRVCILSCTQSFCEHKYIS